jgi:hypothetical protein
MSASNLPVAPDRAAFCSMLSKLAWLCRIVCIVSGSLATLLPDLLQALNL